MSKYQLENKGAGWKFKCPKCGAWAYLDDDQIAGKVSIYHDIPHCLFHETIDLRKYIKEQN